MSGYQRLEAVAVGPGAAAVLQAVTARDWCAKGESVPVGEVLEVYDRSAYLRIDRELTASLDMPGPRLILLGGDGFDGPLTMRLTSERPGGFDPSGLAAGATCQIRPSRRGNDDGTSYVLGVGPALEVLFDLREAVVSRPQIEPRTGVHIQRGDLAWQAADRTLTELIESGADDGLNWLSHLERWRQDGETSLIDGYAQAWSQAASQGWPEGPPPVVESLLGRGPGATPSGDDVLSGTLLVLLHVTQGRAHERVREAGEGLAARAAERTTSISAALLAQATRGRASDTVWRAIQSHTEPAADTTERQSSVDAIASLGHSSGVDTLVGILVGMLLVAPEISR